MTNKRFSDEVVVKMSGRDSVLNNHNLVMFRG